jgi:hypothetical protein
MCLKVEQPVLLLPAKVPSKLVTQRVLEQMGEVVLLVNVLMECEIGGLDRLDLIDIDDLAARRCSRIVERPERTAADRPIEARRLIALEQDRACLSAGVRG